MNLLLLGLWTLDAFVVVETFVVTCSRSGAPNRCGLCLGLLLKGSGFRLEGIPIVEGEPNLCVRFIGEEGETFVVVEPLCRFTPLQRGVLP